MMRRRDEVIQKIIKMLRLARNAGTEAEAHTALTLAQKLMYAHDVEEHEVDGPEVDGPEVVQPIDDAVVDEMGRHVDWKEYLAAIVAENFRCAYIISESRSTGTIRLVFVGRRADVAIAREAYETSAIVAGHLAEQCAQSRAPHEQPAARASFLTGFLRGLCGRFDENKGSTALMVIADPEVIAEAQAFANGGQATGGRLPVADGEALRAGYESGYAHGSGERALRK